VTTHTCTESKSYFFRSQCADNGVLTIVNNQVLVQTTGLSGDHPEAEFVVETCAHQDNLPPPSKQLPPIVRYRHKKSKRYICFSKRGKVRTVGRRQVDKRGLLCMFRQRPVDQEEDYVEANTYHRLQSVHNRRWHLGFNHKNSSLSLIKGKEPHRGALPRHGKSYNPKKCDFKFFAGEHIATSTSEEVWDGLFELVNRNKMVSKAVNLNNAEVSSNQVRADFGKAVKISENNMISKAPKEALQQQNGFIRKNRKYRNRRKNRIRHAQHKKPRKPRQFKNKLKRRKKPISKSKY